MLIAAILAITTGCKKTNNAEEPQPDPVAALKTKVVAKWQRVKGTYTEYDANGGVINVTDLSPIPVYDIQANDKFYIIDPKKKREFFYTLSVTSDGAGRKF